MRNKQITIGIRADGNEKLGMGHLMRCISIARAMRVEGATCVFFVAQQAAGAFLREQGFLCEVLDTDYLQMETELPMLERLAVQYGIQLWLVDSYQATQPYFRALQKWCPVYYLDDCGRFLAADGVINYNIYGEKLDYVKECPPGMEFLLGAVYAPVKEEFVRTPYLIRKEVQRILITMGGSDALNIGGDLCEALLERLDNVEIHIICGRFNPHLKKLRELQSCCDRVRILVDVPDMWNKIANADIAISAAGSTMYELSAMGVPTVCCYYVENQRLIAEEFARQTGMCNAGDYSLEPQRVRNKIVDAVCTLESSYEERKRLATSMKQVTDGLGAQRLAERLIKK